MFEVFDNNKPAKYPHFDVDISWHTNRFYTFEDALAYASDWLGYPLDDLKISLEINVPFDYNGFGDCIEIRSEELPFPALSHTHNIEE